MTFTVFVSYSTRDLSLGSQVKQMLEQTGTSVYLAEYSAEPGTVLSNYILSAIRSCDLFLLLWSHYARASEWVPQEIGIAKAAGKPILPVVLHGGIDLPGFIKDLKYLALYKNPQAALAWLRENVYQRAQNKAQAEGLAWLGLGAVVVWLLNRERQ